MARLLVVLAVLASASACTTKIGIIRQSPASINLSPARRVVVNVSSRDKSQPEAALAMELMMAQERRHDPEYPVRLLQNALARRFQSGHFSLAPAESAQCGIHLKVTDWTHTTEKYTPATTKENPHPADSMRVLGMLNADATIACGHLGATPILRTYSLKKRLDTNEQNVTADHHEKLLETEVEELASQIAESVTPRTYAQEVEIDDSSSLVKPAVELIRAGDLDGAYDLMANLVKQHPQCAPAYFNMGVIAEARGDYKTARAHYDDARRNGNLSMYDQGVARVDQTVADLNALAGQTPP